MEYCDFIINYKLKFEFKKDESDSNDWLEVKKKNAQYVITAFQLLETMKTDIFDPNNTPNYYKSFLDLYKASKRENIQFLEIPTNILYQNINYLKGKFMKYLGNYSQALKFFYKSRETDIICDSNIIDKSIKQITKIMNLLNEKLNEKNNEHQEKLAGLKEQGGEVLNTKNINFTKDQINSNKSIISKYVNGLK